MSILGSNKKSLLGREPTVLIATHAPESGGNPDPMTSPVRLEFPIAKAEYLLNHTTEPGEGGDKRKFWHEVMGFQSAEAIREAVLAEVSLDSLEPQGQNAYGERYQAVILITGPSRVSWLIRTGWIVLFGEDVARFVTAVPERFGRQQ